VGALVGGVGGEEEEKKLPSKGIPNL